MSTGSLDFAAYVGALRSRTVARLAGVSLAQLRYWHESDMIAASTSAGSRGYPRLWSWSDYMRVRAAEKLLREGLSTQRVREAIRELDRAVPDWFLRSIHGYAGRALVQTEQGIVDATGQRMIPEVWAVLNLLQAEGPLGRLCRFGEAVDMNPDVVAGNPVVKGTRIETRLIARLAAHAPRPYFEEAYGLSSRHVDQVIGFERAIA